MIEKTKFPTARIGLIVTPEGVDNIYFSSKERRDDLNFYIAIEEEIRAFENRVSKIAKETQGVKNGK